MTEIQKMIAGLEEQKASLDRAIAALREVAGAGPTPQVRARAARGPARKKRRLSEEGRRRISEAAKRRWAAEAAAKAETKGKPARKKRATKKAAKRRAGRRAASPAQAETQTS